MPSKQVFEKHMNKNLKQEAADQEAAAQQAGPSSYESEPDHYEEKDLAEKDYDRKAPPPRFSKIFAPAAPAPAPAPREVESYALPRKRSGIYISWPIFILFAVLFFFESTVIFAYTVIGLYKNTPGPLFDVFGVVQPVAGSGCAAADNTMPSINIAPNVVLPNGSANTGPQKVTVTNQLTSTLTTTASLSTTATASYTAAAASSNAAQAASELLGFMGAITSTLGASHASTSTSLPADPGATTSTLILSEVPQRSTVNSIKYITVHPSAAPDASSAAPPTTTITSLPGQSTTASVPNKAAESASIAAAMSSQSAQLTPSPIPSTTITPSTVATSPSSAAPTTTPPPPPPSTTVSPPLPSSTSASGGTMGPCFGGSGAVALNCVA